MRNATTVFVWNVDRLGSLTGCLTLLGLHMVFHAGLSFGT
jgi:hypothetical protein